VKLTTRSEYGLLALVHLARCEKDVFVRVQDIAEAQRIPQRFLEQILLVLNRAGYVKSLKGQKGGYRLAKAPREITLAEVIRLFDGALAPTESVSQYFYETTPVEREKKLLGVFRQIRDLVANKLEKTTLADVA
jgi:Rrf2 family transcriptional regulator, cysteine metabolism repressor